MTGPVFDGFLPLGVGRTGPNHVYTSCSFRQMSHDLRDDVAGDYLKNAKKFDSTQPLPTNHHPPTYSVHHALLLAHITQFNALFRLVSPLLHSPVSSPFDPIALSPPLHFKLPKTLSLTPTPPPPS